MALTQRLAAGIASAAIGMGVLGAAGLPAIASAAPNQQGGAAGLVAAVVQVQNVQVIDDINVRFNDINVIQDVLNRSPILNNNDIDVNVITIDDALNNNIVTLTDLVDLNVALDDVVAVVQVLGGGVLVLT